MATRRTLGMRGSLSLLVVGVMALLALPRSAAAHFGTDHVTNAQTFLENEAQNSLGLIQTGCKLKGASADSVMRGLNGSFTVVVHYDWSGPDNGNDYTKIHYKFDSRGRLTSLKVGETSAVVFTPYSVADLGIGVLRDALLREVRRAPADDPIRRAIEPFIAGANARSLHLMQLRLRQPR